MILRLAIFLTVVGLAASRLGLIAHEYVGHGGAALLAGGDVLEVKLFWFAGGWIRYEIPEPSTAKFLFVAMGGIGLELVIGSALWLVPKDRILRGLGSAFVIHALWYLAIGGFHGFGDGVLLHRELGGARVPFSLAIGALLLVAAFVGARGVIGALLAKLPARPILGFAIAAAIAGSINIGLGIGEMRLRRDDTYAQTMRPERERQILAELARWQAAHPHESPVVEQKRLETVHEKPFPFALVLGIATIVALGLGAWRTRIGEHSPTSNRQLAIAGAIAAASVIATIAIDLLS